MYHFWYDMTDDEKRLRARFYQSAPGGRIPMREWLLDLSPDDRKAIGADIKTVEFGWPIGMPVCRPLGDGLWEIRSNISDGQIARVLFCIAQNQMILLHGFIKKTQKTPTGDLELARRRMKDVMP